MITNNDLLWQITIILFQTISTVPLSWDLRCPLVDILGSSELLPDLFSSAAGRVSVCNICCSALAPWLGSDIIRLVRIAIHCILCLLSCTMKMQMVFTPRFVDISHLLLGNLFSMPIYGPNSIGISDPTYFVIANSITNLELSFEQW